MTFYRSRPAMEHGASSLLSPRGLSPRPFSLRGMDEAESFPNVRKPPSLAHNVAPKREAIGKGRASSMTFVIGRSVNALLG
jgi:hypothetical protein